jgi:hypothetical protein
VFIRIQGVQHYLCWVDGPTASSAFRR